MKFINTLEDISTLNLLKSYSDFFKKKLGKIQNTYPSKLYGEKIGLDIHTDWKIPFSLSVLDIARVIIFLPERNYYKQLNSNDKKYTDIINLLYKGFIYSNPILSKVNVKTRQDKYDLIYGALSKINFDDIKFYTEFGESKFIFKDVIADSDEYRKEKLDELENIFGPAKYMMSSITLEKVLEYLRKNKKVSI